MAQPTGRNVEVRMKFVADAKQAQGEMAATRREVEKLGKEAQRTQQEMKRMGAGGGGGGAGGTPGAGGAGGGGGTPGSKDMAFAMALGKATALLAIFGQALQGAAKAAGTYYGRNDWTNKSAGAAYSLIDSLTFGPVDKSRQEIESTYYGKSRAANIESMRLEPIRQTRLGLTGSLNQQSGAIWEQRGSAEDAYSAAMALAGGRGGIVGGLMQGMGLRDERDARIIQAERGKAESYQGTLMGESAKARADSEVRRLQKILGGLRSEKLMAEEASGLTGNKYQHEIRKTNIRLKDTEILQRQQELQKAIENQNATGLALEQKRHALRQANLNFSKAELDIIKEKEQKAKGAASEFGMMSGSDKIALKYALQQAQSQGIDALPEETRRLLAGSGLTGEWAREQSEKSVQDDFNYQQIVAMLGGKTSEQLGKERLTIENKIELDSQTDAEELAKGMRQQWDQYLDMLEPLIQKIANQQLKLALNQRKQMD